MGNRLSRIYTRTGDQGTTGLGDGERVAKDCPRIEAIGAVDELNCMIGRVLMHDLREPVRDCLQDVQHRLFDLGGELSIPGYQAIKDEDVTALETMLNSFNEQLPPLKEFILPGGGRGAADCHMARAICRRAERRVVSLAREGAINEPARVYLNRLSDLLFVLCRVIVRDEGGLEVLWRNPGRS
ncbi:MAG: cob(I)yrinic acid a,c-diamide adenosyltransferase [Gammaproteobacteria bacterium]|nr:cob(I)yrinic acid a,c-diamide adenosyltransferase [Gammaproteobacteria bacterium]MCP5197764.1 cob(I)yrinic acid a,c-diamide adenosyltransferase [Gammaproteobacteria bacterium]